MEINPSRYTVTDMGYETPCWIWNGRQNKNGYCETSKASETGGGRMYAHRASWVVKNGKIPDGMMVCHKCDTRNCVNPNHFFLGDHHSNAVDMVSKNRHEYPKGENSRSAKLKALEVLEIKKLCRLSSLTLSQIGARFGISTGHVSCIALGKTWRHIGGAVRERKDSKLSDDDVRHIRLMSETGISTLSIASKYKVNTSTIFRIVKNERRML